MCGATLLAVHATHHVGAVFDGLQLKRLTNCEAPRTRRAAPRLGGVESTLPACHSLANDFGVLVDPHLAMLGKNRPDVGSSQICFLESFQEFGQSDKEK